MKNRTFDPQKLAILATLFLVLILLRGLYVFWPYPDLLGVSGFAEQVLHEESLVKTRVSADVWSEIRQVQQWLHDIVFLHLGFAAYLREPQDVVNTGFLSDYVADLTGALYYSVLQVGLRLGTLIQMLPWFLLCALLAVLDGLCARSRRRHLVALESSFLYRRGINLAVVVCLAMGLYLLLPWAMPLAWVFVPALLLLTLSAWVVACYFRKYI